MFVIDDLMIDTNIIVLRKTPFSESSLVIASVSADYGRLDFLARGAMRVEKKRFPEVDLFRELNVHFKEGAKGLYTINSVEIVGTSDAISLRTGNFILAAEIAEFVLRNSHTMLPSPILYSSLRGVLKILCGPLPENPPVFDLLKLVYLYEHGLLPGHSMEEAEKNPDGLKRIRFTGMMVNFLCKGDGIPDLGTEYWHSFSEWINNLCEYHGLANIH